MEINNRLLYMIPVLIISLLCIATTSAQDIPEVCENESVVPFSIIHPWHDDVPPGEIRCLVIDVEAGEKERTVVKIAEKPPFTGAGVELFLPGDAEPILNPMVANVNRRDSSMVCSIFGKPHTKDTGLAILFRHVLQDM
jgi:hypothetical protein